MLPLLLRQLHGRVMLLRATSMQLPGRSAQSIMEISAIVKAIDQRDPDTADAAAAEHVRRAAAAAFAVLKAAHQFRPASQRGTPGSVFAREALRSGHKREGGRDRTLV